MGARLVEEVGVLIHDVLDDELQADVLEIIVRWVFSRVVADGDLYFLVDLGPAVVLDPAGQLQRVTGGRRGFLVAASGAELGPQRDALRRPECEGGDELQLPGAGAQ